MSSYRTWENHVSRTSPDKGFSLQAHGITPKVPRKIPSRLRKHNAFITDLFWKCLSTIYSSFWYCCSQVCGYVKVLGFFRQNNYFIVYILNNFRCCEYLGFLSYRLFQNHSKLWLIIWEFSISFTIAQFLICTILFITMSYVLEIELCWRRNLSPIL